VGGRAAGKWCEGGVGAAFVSLEYELLRLMMTDGSSMMEI